MKVDGLRGQGLGFRVEGSGSLQNFEIASLVVSFA